ncbi:MAG TPA: hypothetical protein VG328_05655 [Stellaceae bacterium]|jgi:hypothetical protein|nr:hypothetical protein [Stellaceae bacterium]
MTTQTASEIGSCEGDRSTHFLFDHKVFTLKGAHFALTEDGSTPAFHVELGTLVASLPLGMLHREFGIDRDSNDGTLLAVVEKSLRFVKEIRPGDSIPRELLDGSASWSVEDRHRLRAKAYLWARAIGTDDLVGAKDDVLEAFVERPETKTRLQAAANEIATKLGCEMTAESVLARIDELGRELAYIEALQERCGDVLNIVPKVNQLARVYRSDRAIVDELSRIRTLMLKPIELYDGIFARLTKRQEKIEEAIGQLHARVEFIREQRDDLHQGLMLWDPVLAGWAIIEMSRCNDTETKIANLYRFIARHYLTSQSWEQGAA